MWAFIHNAYVYFKYENTIFLMLGIDILKCVFLQYSFYQQLHEQKKSEKFFKVLYDRMKAAQKEIRSTVTVNTIDLGNKKRDDDNELMTSGPRMRGKEIIEYWEVQNEKKEGNTIFRPHIVFSLILV